MRIGHIVGVGLATAALLQALISRAQEPAPAPSETDEAVVLNFEGRVRKSDP